MLLISLQWYTFQSVYLTKIIIIERLLTMSLLDQLSYIIYIAIEVTALWW